MYRSTTHHARLAGLALACAVALPLAASAQDKATTPVTPISQKEIEEIIVTGSLIARDPGNYVGPMTMVTDQALEQIPSYSLKDVLDQLPAIGNQATGKNNSNGGRGIEFTEIHQLETERTLVLLNGRRMISTIRDSAGLGVDLQSFPINAIERIEVLADGASATYGSDAIAGVVNIITKKNFEGLEITAGAGAPQDEGGETYNLGGLWGVSTDRGYFSAGVTWKKTKDIDYQDRSWSKDPFLSKNTLLDDGGTPNDPSDDLWSLLYGSGIPPEGRQPDAGLIFIPDTEAGTSYQFYDTFCLGQDPSLGAPGSLECIKNLGHRYNYNDIPGGNSLINDGTVINFMANGEYTFDNGTTGYVEALFAHRDNLLTFTPLPIADAHGQWTDMIPVPYDNPWVPADALAEIQAANPGCLDEYGGQTCFQMYWRGLDAGQRIFDVDSDTYKATTGLRGDLMFMDREMSWDTWFTMGHSTLNEVTDNQVNATNLRIAMDREICTFISNCPKVTPDNLAAAQAENPNVQVGDPLVNIFGRNPFTQAEKNFLLYDDQDQTTYDMYHLGGVLTGDAFTLPAGDVGFAAGLEWRRERGETQPSGVVQLGDSGGNTSFPTKGEYRVLEAFAEFNIPLLRDAPLAEALDLDAAVRWSDYDTFGSETTYKASLSWAPVQDLRFRGVVSTGFRGPNVLELYGGLSDSYELIDDPCSGWDQVGADPVVAANCQAEGVPPGYIQNASQLKVSQGGNPDLEAEESDNFSIGVVIEPRFVERLRVAIDYYDVEVDNAVGTPNSVDVIDSCYSTPGLASPTCDRFARNASGTIVQFLLLNENLGSVETSGVDFNSSYALDTGLGELQFGWLVNWLNEYKETTLDGIVDDRTDKVAGVIADYVAYPEWRSNFDVTLNRDNWSAGLTWRYLDEMEIFDALGFENVITKADSVNYFDLHGSYQVGDWEFGAGVENLPDEDPPYVPDTSANTSAVYDWVGRFYYIRAGVKFE
ncbi:MAG: TonB-dependent receptor [Gammaproteobacteria bacterium]|nr:TonB-dependent receptor [Gammaproteobacteria bacterium]